MAIVTISSSNGVYVYNDGVLVETRPPEEVKEEQIVRKPAKSTKREVFNSKFYLPDYEHDLIQEVLYNSGSYFEYSFLTVSDQYLSKNPVIIDIGANIGNHTLYWANESGAAKIYSFEPVPSTFKILKKNIKINNLEDRVKLFNVGLSDYKSEGCIISFDPNNIGGTRIKECDKKSADGIKLVTLDSFDIQEPKIDLIKIDVEGMDYKVLFGSIDTIKKYKPVIMIESFPDEYRITHPFLRALGYRKECELGSFEYIYVYDEK